MSRWSFPAWPDEPERPLAQLQPPEGFVYQPDFVTRAEEAELVRFVRALPLKGAQYLQYTARRRIVSFGGSYDFSSQELRPAGPIPESLHPVRARIAELMAVPAQSVNHALVAEYQAGTPEPRSAYAMRGTARWNWQHAISPTRELRYSITFRTLA